MKRSSTCDDGKTAWFYISEHVCGFLARRSDSLRVSGLKDTKREEAGAYGGRERQKEKEKGSRVRGRGLERDKERRRGYKNENSRDKERERERGGGGERE